MSAVLQKRAQNNVPSSSHSLHQPSFLSEATTSCPCLQQCSNVCGILPQLGAPGIFRRKTCSDFGLQIFLTNPPRLQDAPDLCLQLLR